MLGSYEEELKKNREEMHKSRTDEHVKYEKGIDYVEERVGGPPHLDHRGKFKPPKKAEISGFEPSREEKERSDEPYMTFPGHISGQPPGGALNPGEAYGQNPMHDTQGAQFGYPGSYYSYYSPYYSRAPMEPFGVTSATLGIVAMCIFWISVFPTIGTLFYIVIVCMTGISIIFGGYSFIAKKRRNVRGLVGLILSIIAITLSTIIWVFSNIPPVE
jgi:hypothetical protein